MKRTPLTRSTPLRRDTGEARLTLPVFKPKTCSKARGGCGEKFTPLRAMQVACGGRCAMNMATRARLKDEAQKAKEQKAADRKRREAMKPTKKLRAEAQKAVNEFCRNRDRLAGYGCICCGAPLEWDSGMPGGSVDAGHFVSRGSMPTLALDPRNISAQRKSCNRPGGTTRDAFRAGMVERWGQAIVDELEGPQPILKLTPDDYRSIRDEFRAKTRALLKERT